MSGWHRRNPDYTEPRNYPDPVDRTIDAMESEPQTDGAVLIAHSGRHRVWERNGVYLLTDGCIVTLPTEDRELALDVFQVNVRNDAKGQA